MGLSVNEFDYSGSDVFDLNFALGVFSRTDVTCEYDSNGVTLSVDFDWLSDNQVRLVSGHNVSTGDTVRFIRTVSKVSPVIDLTQPGNLTREAAQSLFVQSMHVMHELLDGRIADVTEVSDEVLTIVSNAVREALIQSGVLATYKYPVQIGGELTSELFTNCGSDLSTDQGSFAVSVFNPPSTTTEFLLSDASKVIFSFTVDSTGQVAVTSYSTSVEKGMLELSVVGSDYSTGAKLAITVEGVDTELLEFSDMTPDFLTTYEEAKE